MKVKIIGLLAALAAMAVLAIVATVATGAYFSDSHPGTISGTVGDIKVSAGVNADFGGGLNFSFHNLMPGEPQSGTVYYTNSGPAAEDVWIVFPDADALKALNNVGTFGSVAIVDAMGGVNWVSNNLNAYYPSGTDGGPNPTLYHHVPNQMLLQSNVTPGNGGSMTFTYTIASKTTTHQGEAWNNYPVAAEPNSNGEVYTPPYTVGLHNGLPYQIVATQVGQKAVTDLRPPLRPVPTYY